MAVHEHQKRALKRQRDHSRGDPKFDHLHNLRCNMLETEQPDNHDDLDPNNLDVHFESVLDAEIIARSELPELSEIPPFPVVGTKMPEAVAAAGGDDTTIGEEQGHILPSRKNPYIEDKESFYKQSF